MAPKKKGKGKKKKAQRKAKAPSGGGGPGPAAAAGETTHGEPSQREPASVAALEAEAAPGPATSGGPSQRDSSSPLEDGAQNMAGPEPRDRGHLVGLRSRPDLNGRRVEVEGPDAGKDGAPRFRVELLFGAGAGTVLKVKAANLDLDKDSVLDDPAMATLVAEMQALAPGATPAEERRDWAGGVPIEVLAKIAQKHVAQTEARFRSSLKSQDLEREFNGEEWIGIQPKMAQRERDGNCLLVFAMVCKEWRKAQLKVGGPLRTRVNSDVAMPGQVALAKWALAEGCPREMDRWHNMATAAAEHGHGHLVRWLIQEQGFAVDDALMQCAARGGNLALVKWLRGEGCGLSTMTGVYAAQGGHLQVVKWLRAHGCQWHPHTCIVAAKHGRLEVLRWALANGCDLDGENCAFHAASGGHFEMLQWLRATGCPWDHRTCAAAALNGQMEVLRWAHENGCPFDDGGVVAGNAATGGHLEILKWLRAQGCSWSGGTCYFAARMGHVEMLHWARENGCPWDAEVCVGAAWGGQLEILKWLRANGCPWDAGVCAAAAKYGHVKVLRWARENGCEWDEEACAGAAAGGHLEILKWLRANGCPWNSDVCAAAAEFGHVKVLRWARENECEWDAETRKKAAEEFGYTDRLGNVLGGDFSVQLGGQGFELNVLGGMPGGALPEDLAEMLNNFTNIVNNMGGGG